ncbi:MAG: ferredoxin reductase family protein [Actinomycetes bacterium]
MTQSTQENTRALILAEPSPRVRLTVKTFKRLQSKQDLVEAIGWLSIVWVTLTFLVDGGLNNLGNQADLLNAVGRLSALVATDLLLIQVLLIARVPWLDRLYGHDRATLTHKKLGKPVLYLVIAHFLATIWSYSVSDSLNVWAEFISLLNSISEVVYATIAFVLMVLVVVTSLNLARKKLPYEAWYLIHLFAYGAVMLAIPHQINLGVDIAGKPLALGFWVSAYLFIALNIIWFRLLSPIFFSAVHGLKVAETVIEASDATSIHISGRKLNSFGASSGQFFIVRVVTWKQWWRAHPFSLSAAPTKTALRFTVGNRGDDTALLQNIKPGTRVILEGPYGVFTEARRTQEHVVLVAAGIGAPPIRALAETIAARPGEVSILYRVRNSNDAALISELKEIAKRRGFYIHILEGSRKHPQSWFPAGVNDQFSDHERLSSLVPNVSTADVYICGPSAFTKAVERSLAKAGTPLNQIHTEEFAW